MPYLQLVYASAAKHTFTEEELAELLRISRENNAKIDVTGILLFLEGSFLQVLEGDPEAVTELYEIINLDLRHGKVILLTKREIEERGFAEWSMGYVNATGQAARLEGLFDILAGRRDFAELADQHEALTAILDGFIDGKWRRTIA